MTSVAIATAGADDQLTVEVTKSDGHTYSISGVRKVLVVGNVYVAHTERCNVFSFSTEHDLFILREKT